MKNVLLALLLSCSIFASEPHFLPDPSVKGLEYCIKPNGIVVFRSCGARVPEKKDHQEPQVLNPEFLCDVPIPDKKQEEKKEEGAAPSEKKV